MGFDYTVSKDDLGLTYIFLEQAKKQAGFDGSKKSTGKMSCQSSTKFKKKNRPKVKGYSAAARTKPAPAGAKVRQFRPAIK